MRSRNSFLLLGALVVAVVAAFFRTQSRPAVSEPEAQRGEPERVAPPLEAPAASQLPPNHPPIGNPNMPSIAEPTAEAPAITWKAPKKWTVAPNANAMRLVTYHVPAVTGAADETELTVVRAGGSAEANIQRWIGQFADRGEVNRTKETVQGLQISVLEVSGTFQGGGMGPGGATPRPNWTLLGAIVETENGPYFFKLTGPTATARAARPDFDALIDSIAPAAKK